MKKLNIRRGDIFYADLSPVIGSEQGGVRPVLIVQNDVGNRFSPTVIAAAITSQRAKANLPTHIMLEAENTGLARDSIVLLEQIRTCLLYTSPLTGSTVTAYCFVRLCRSKGNFAISIL